MRGHNIHFPSEIRKIVFELSSKSPLIWSSEWQVLFIPSYLISIPLDWLYLDAYYAQNLLVKYIMQLPTVLSSLLPWGKMVMIMNESELQRGIEDNLKIIRDNYP